DAAHGRELYTDRRRPTPVTAPQKSTSCGVSFTSSDTANPTRSASTTRRRGRLVATHTSAASASALWMPLPHAPVAPFQETDNRGRRWGKGPRGRTACVTCECPPVRASRPTRASPARTANAPAAASLRGVVPSASTAYAESRTRIPPPSDPARLHPT